MSYKRIAIKLPVIFFTISLYGMQKPYIPKLLLPIKEFEEQIIHLDLPFKLDWDDSKYGSWYYGWPQDEYLPAEDKKLRMLGLIESRIKNRQDLRLPITPLALCSWMSCSETNFRLRIQSSTLMYDTVSSDYFIEVTKKLLACGVDPNAVCFRSKSDSESRPLQEAVYSGAYKTVELLLKIPGINPHIQNRYGNSLLNYAICASSKNTIQIMRLLLNAGVNPNALNCEGQNILFRIAYETEDVRSKIELLCEYGMRLDIKDKYGRTAVEHVRYLHDQAKNSRCQGALPKAILIIEEEGSALQLIAKLRKDGEKKPTYFNILTKEIVVEVACMVCSKNIQKTQ